MNEIQGQVDKDEVLHRVVKHNQRNKESVIQRKVPIAAFY